MTDEVLQFNLSATAVVGVGLHLWGLARDLLHIGLPTGRSVLTSVRSFIFSVILLDGKSFSPVLIFVLPHFISCPLYITDPANCGPPTTTGEVERTVNLPNVLDHQLLAGLHPKVTAELAAPVEVVGVGGQEDGAGETGLLGHPVNLQQVGFYHLVLQE